jgi:hypothetical protein
MIHNLPTCRLLTVDDDSLDDIPKGAMLDQGLPHPGSWIKLGRRDEVSEETWKEIIGFTAFMTATASARSLIAGNPVVLIERKKE